MKDFGEANISLGIKLSKTNEKINYLKYHYFEKILNEFN